MLLFTHSVTGFGTVLFHPESQRWKKALTYKWHNETYCLQEENKKSSLDAHFIRVCLFAGRVLVSFLADISSLILNIHSS